MRILKLLSLFITFLFFAGCRNNLVSKTVSLLETGDVETTETALLEAQRIAMSIEGMVCAVGCAAMIEKNLNKTKGIRKAKVDFETKKATLIFDPKILSANEITQIVNNTGKAYSVKDFKLLD